MGMMARRAAHHRVAPEAFAVNGFPLLEFDRKPIDPSFLTGFVLSRSDDLTLIQVLDRHAFRLNGYAVFRNSDVRRWRAILKDEFLARVTRLHRLRPSKPNAVTIASMKRAAASAGATFPLITIHRERINRRICSIGKMLRTSQRAVSILSITPQAEWEERESYSLKEITLLEFGGIYEGLLFRLAK